MGSVGGILRVVLLVVLTAQIAPAVAVADTQPPKLTVSPSPLRSERPWSRSRRAAWPLPVTCPTERRSS